MSETIVIMEPQDTITQMLDDLAAIESERDAALAEHPARVNYDVLMAEIRECNVQLTAAALPFEIRLAVKREAIIKSVREHGETVKGKVYMAVYSKGRESVDVPRFKGYILSHPEAEALLKVGEPSVSIRSVK